MRKIYKKDYGVNIGDKFSNWTVIEYLDIQELGRGQIVLVECSCENKTKFQLQIYNLIKGLSESCGCKYKGLSNKGKFKTELTIKYPEFGTGRAKDRSHAYTVISGIKSAATKRNLVFELKDLEAFEKYCLGSCFYCGFTPNWPETHNGIDRYDNEKGYIEGNCVSCCIQCNFAKSDKTFDFFKNQITKIYFNFILNNKTEWIENIDDMVYYERKRLSRIRRKGFNITELGKKYPLNYGLGMISYAQKIWITVSSDAKKFCRKRCLQFQLDDIYGFEHFIIGTCTYCGLKPQFPSTRNGIDRIDSNKGYTKDNCVACCKYCNKIKCDLSIEEFKYWIIKIYNNLTNNILIDNAKIIE